MKRKIPYEKFEREFEEILAPRIGILKERYQIKSCITGNFGTIPQVELYLKKEDVNAIRERRLEDFPVFRIIHKELIIPDYKFPWRQETSYVTLKTILDRDISKIVFEVLINSDKNENHIISSQQNNQQGGK